MCVINILTCKTFWGGVRNTFEIISLFIFLGGCKKCIGDIWTIINVLES